MIKVNFTCGERISEIVSKEMTIIDFLNTYNNGYPDGCTLSIGGKVVPRIDVDKTFKELTNNADTCTMYALAKTDHN